MAAMHAFRREGYAHISVAELESATGLRTSSLYHAFGDKAGLFRRALDHYVSTLVEPRLILYAGPGPRSTTWSSCSSPCFNRRTTTGTAAWWSTPPPSSAARIPLPA